MGSPERLRVVQYGVGPIGLSAIRTILARRDMELVGAIDIDPDKQQRDVADLGVSDRPDEVLGVSQPDVVLHTTQSRLAEVLPQLRSCLEAKANVVSTCEELLLPSVRHPKLARELDALARSKEAIILGTGVNPGFVMDTMALVSTAPCLEVRSILVERVVNAATRRAPLQKKVGAGMTPAEFRRGARKGRLGHVGLLESLHLVAQGLGWELDRVTEKLTPVLAEKAVRTPHLTVKAGQVSGIHHVCRGFRNRKEALKLDLQMFVGAKKPLDRILIRGNPSLDILFDGGVAGDEATVGMLLTMARGIVGLRPGLRTMIDATLPRFRSGV
jgi:4-hydroxy-tetrahydrodipicolinate reductase